MRPTNFCHLHDTAIAHTSCVLGSLRGFHRVDVPRSLGLRATVTEGPSASRHSWPLQRTATGHTLPCLLILSRLAVRELSSVGFFSPRRPLRSSLWHLCRLSLFRGIVGQRFRAAFSAFTLAGLFAVPREEAAKTAVTTFSW